MGYFYILIALLAGCTKGYCGKKISNNITNFLSAIKVNFIRFFICTLFGFIVTLFTEGLPIISIKTIPIFLISGIAQAIFVITWILAVKNCAYTTLDVFLMISILIPTFLCRIFYSESINFLQWIGFIVLVVAMLIMCSYSNSINRTISPITLFLVIICSFSNGIADFSQKWYLHATKATNVSTFNLYTFFFAMIILGVTLIFKKENKEDSSIKLSSCFVYILIMAICLFLNSIFKTLAGKTLNSMQIYPILQGLSMICSVIMSAVFFKEPIKKKSVLGMIIAFFGILLTGCSEYFIVIFE